MSKPQDDAKNTNETNNTNDAKNKNDTKSTSGAESTNNTKSVSGAKSKSDKPLWITSILFFVLQGLSLFCFSETTYNSFGMVTIQVCITIFCMGLLFYAGYYKRLTLQKEAEEEILKERGRKERDREKDDAISKRIESLEKSVENLTKQPSTISQEHLERLAKNISVLTDKNITAKQFEEWINVLEKLKIKEVPQKHHQKYPQ